MSTSRKRQAVLPAVLLIVGLAIVFIAAAAAGSNDVAQATCELEQAMDGGYADCEDQGQGEESAGFIIGGAMAGIGLLGLVIVSAMGAVIDNTPRRGPPTPTRPAAPVPTQADELKKAADLLSSGAITAEEFVELKSQILGSTADR